MEAREAALRFRAGDRLQTAFLKKLEAVDGETAAQLAVFVGEPKLAGRILRLVPATHAKRFVDAALEPWPGDVPKINQTHAWARHHRHEVARAALRVLVDVAERKTKRAFEFLAALFSADDPDSEWGQRARAAVAKFGVERVKELATRVFEIAEGQTLASLIAERLIWLAVHSARGPEALRALVEDARRDARSGSTRPRAAIAVARALQGVEPALARPELERMKVRVRHRVVLREVEKSLAALGEGPEPGLPPGVSLDEAGELVFEGKPAKGAKRAAEELLSVQRALLEQHMIHERTWSAEQWVARFVGHSVLENLARRLVWLADGEAALWREGGFEDLDARNLQCSRIQVAHPVLLRELERVQRVVAERGIVQPWRQVTREIYTVTAAERTVTWCTRFVNEVVPFDTLYALSKQRGWSGLYTQPGEGSSEGTKLFGQGWRARLEIHEARHALGVCLGELSFETKKGREVTVHELGQVPPVVFSETCRDLDLVVGVGTLGDDSLGVLPATTATRREIVERLVPFLGLGDRARVEGRYVWVKGELREYRVHVASAHVHALPSGRAIVFPEALATPDLHLPADVPADARAIEVLRRVITLAGDALVTDPELAAQLGDA